MAENTKGRRNVKRPTRSLAVLAATPDRTGLVVRITVGSDTDEYNVRAIPSQFGAGFRVTRLTRLAEPNGILDVHLADDGRTCECLGFGRWGHCKHTDGLAVLVERGELRPLHANGESPPAAPELAAADADAYGTCCDDSLDLTDLARLGA